MLQQAVEGTKSLDQDKLADYLRSHTFKTVVGDVKFGPTGEWAEARVMEVQFQNVKANDMEQFKDPKTEVILSAAGAEDGRRDLSLHGCEEVAGSPTGMAEGRVVGKAAGILPMSNQRGVWPGENC